MQTCNRNDFGIATVREERERARDIAGSTAQADKWLRENSCASSKMNMLTRTHDDRNEWMAVNNNFFLQMIAYILFLQYSWIEFNG